jgi:serine/threonine protein kinase
VNFEVLNLQMFRSGGNGDLYLGQRSDTGEWVVVKFLREYHLDHCRKAFAREVRVLLRKSRGMIPLLAWNLAVERPFYVMPYLEGGPLSHYAGRLVSTQLQQVAENLAMTLANLHAALDLHGDFKPDNVLLTKQGLLQVADPLATVRCLRFCSPRIEAERLGIWHPKSWQEGRFRARVMFTLTAGQFITC